MSIISSILDALRKRGSKTQKSALARQDEFIANKTVLERSRRRVRGPSGPIEGFVATVEPIEEKLDFPAPDVAAAIGDNAHRIGEFMAHFGLATQPEVSPEDLDRAFTAWLRSGGTREYPREAAIEILGAAFGNYCIRKLNMRWVVVTDADGVALAVDGIHRKFRSFPYHSVAKRIDDKECDFFVGVYALIDDMSKDAIPRPTASSDL